MSAGETAIACIATAIGLGLIATYGWDAWHKRYGRFQRTARQAARAKQVAADVAKAKADREAEQQAADQAFDQIIAREFPAIPHQTRRTEEPE